jgi:membrane-associated phospholipid phosphatase
MHSHSFQKKSAQKLLCAAIAFLSLSIFFAFLLIAQEINLAWMMKIHSSPFMPPAFWAFTNLGGDAFIVLLILLLAESKPGTSTSWILKTWLTGAIITQFVKILFPMPRPGFVIDIAHLSLIDNPPLASGSMPSGHALAAFSCGLILIFLALEKGKRYSALISIALFTLTVAWSRVAVGAHWPSDVIVGAGLAFFVVTCTRFWELHHTWNHWFHKKSGLRFLALIHLLIAIHLALQQSEFILVQFSLIVLSFISLARAVLLMMPKLFYFSQQETAKR